MHGKLALYLAVMAHKKGTELRTQLNMGVLIVVEVTLKANSAIQIPAQVYFNVILVNTLILNYLLYHPSKLYLEFLDCMGNLLCKLW